MPQKKPAPLPQVEHQELHCHACNNYVQFDIDLSLNGNHTLKCPNCGHEHFRVVRDGVITESRWKSSGPTYYVQYSTYTAQSMYTNYYNQQQQTTTTSSSTASMYGAWRSLAVYERGNGWT